jgi:hypothetical protein
MKRTNKYGLTYYEKGDFTSSKQELQRWETLDNQLGALFEVLGNGVINGWDIIESSGLSVSVTPGSGHVSFVAVKSLNIVSLNLIDNSTNYIYASLTSDSYWTKNVAFHVEVFENTHSNVLLLGTVVTSDGIVAVDGIDTSLKQTLGFISLVNNAVKNHRHIGGLNNPQQVNLATDVYGTLGQDNIGDLDASVIQTGTIDANRLPTISHVTGLSDQGTLTHSQLDSVVNSLTLPDQTTMGEVSSINFLQLVLALKHIYPDIDEFLNNEISIIPGISPDDYIDFVNTTATVDLRTHAEGGTHTIYGQQSSGIQEYTRIWDTEADFNDSTKNDVLVIGDSVSLAVKSNNYVIDDFSDISTWVIETQDLSALPSALSIDSSDYVVAPNSAKLAIGNSSVDIVLKIKKAFISQDWSDYNYLTLFIKTESIEHGDLFFYLNDNTYGQQNSYQIILNRNSPTINIDTLQRGWQEVTIDLTPYIRTNINEIGFYVSTQNGWDTAKGFDFNVDSISLASGNIYEIDGYCRFTFGSDFLYDFWKIRWDAIIPTDTDSSGVEFKVRTRVANSILELSTAIWTDYSSISGYELPIISGEMYKYIEIECYFVASTNFKRSATLKKLYLDFYAVDVDNFFYFNTKSDWDNGYKYNIDTDTVSNSMSIFGTSDISKVYYGTDNSFCQLDSDLKNELSISGSLMPRSTYQVLNGLPPSFGTITGIVRGNYGNLWLSDTDNDRVVEINQSGELVRGFNGSFIEVPVDPYESSNASGLVVNSLMPTTFEAIHCLYNQLENSLYIVFNDYLETIDLKKIYLKIGSQVIYLNDSMAEILGRDAIKYEAWKNILESNASGQMININQFTFDSHVLKVTLQDANKDLLNYLINQKQPSVIINSPLNQQMIRDSNVVVKLTTYNFDLGTDTGEPSIRLTLDGVTEYVVFSKEIELTSLSLGNHTIKVELLDADGIPYTNIEAVANSSFVINMTDYSLPYLYFLSPCSNQIYTSNPIKIEFSLENFAIVPNGQHIKYEIDDDTAVDYYSSDPIVISGLSQGKHSISLYVVNESGTEIIYPYGRAEITFIIGLNSKAVTKLYIKDGATTSIGGNSAIAVNLYVDVANMFFKNIYSPIDVQVVNPNNDKETILIAKLRSPSWLQGLSSSINQITELGKRIIVEANSSAAITLDPEFSSIETQNLIFENGYLDGHSVVELDLEGNLVYSNNDGKIAATKEDAKSILGSCEKISENELLIGDACNKRAIITSMNTMSLTSTVKWEYASDRYVSDFHIVQQDDIVIDIHDTYVTNSSLYIKDGTTIIWKNSTESLIPITIYSGTTSPFLFEQNPTLSFYGKEFQSETILPGESYANTFYQIGNFDWFVYPSILTGRISVVDQRVSDRDNFLIVENDGLDSPFTSRVIKIDSYGNVLWSFGESYLVKPRDVRSLLNGNVIIST